MLQSGLSPLEQLNMQNWFAPSLVALFGFGFWGVFTKLSLDFIDFKSALVYQTVGVLIVGIIGLILVDFRPAPAAKGMLYGILTGLCYALGCFFYFIAVSRGKISTVVTLTALYPLVTIGISYFFFQEVISVKKMLGITCALVAIVLMID